MQNMSNEYDELDKIPSRLLGVLSREISEMLSGSNIDNLFLSCDVDGPAIGNNKQEKTLSWLKKWDQQHLHSDYQTKLRELLGDLSARVSDDHPGWAAINKGLSNYGLYFNGDSLVYTSGAVLSSDYIDQPKGGITDEYMKSLMGLSSSSVGNEPQFTYESNDTDAPSSQAIKRIQKVFIVHGHDHSMKSTVARFVETLGLEAIILHEQDDDGSTIFEKLDRYKNTDCAVALLTPDDIGSSKGNSNLNPRARQNVILELGIFIGMLSRQNVYAIIDKTVEKPSDLDGVIYIPAHDWKTGLIDRLVHSGAEFDPKKMTKALRMV